MGVEPRCERCGIHVDGEDVTGRERDGEEVDVASAIRPVTDESGVHGDAVSEIDHDGRGDRVVRLTGVARRRRLRRWRGRSRLRYGIDRRFRIGRRLGLHRRRAGPERRQCRGHVEQPARGDLAGEARHPRRAREDRRADRRAGRLRIGRGEQRDGAGDVRRRHRRAAVRGVTVAGHGGIDRGARRGDVHARRPIIREARETVRAVGGGDGDHRGARVVGRIGRSDVVVDAFVARGGHEEDARIAARLDRPAEGRRRPAAPPTVVRRDDVDPEVAAHPRRVVDGGDGVARRSAAVAPEELEGHDRHGPVHARDTDAVVARGADRAGDVRAVPLVVEGVAVAVREIPAVHVVDEAVAIIVDAVARHLARVAPHVRGEVGMAVIDARVDHRDDDRAGPGRDIPGPCGVDVGARDPTGLPGVVEAPEASERRVIGHGGRGDDDVRLDRLDAGRA